MILSPDLIVPTQTAFEYQGKIIIARDEYPLWMRFFLRKDQREQQQPPEIIGKWAYHDHPEQLHAFALDLLPSLVEELTPEIKYRPTMNNPKGPFAHLLPPLCIYATNDTKDTLEKRLRECGLDNIYWQSNEATRELHRGIKEAGKSELIV